MSLMEAGTNNVDDARNAAGAMVNRSSLTGTPLGKHVSGAIYQPTIEPSQHSRLAKILSSPQFSEMTDWVSQRQAGSVPDPVNGATHFLAHPNVMLSLERKNPSKYKNWGPRGANWTGYDPNTGQYSGQVFADKSHAFLIPKEMQALGAKPSGEYGGEMTAAANAPDPAAAIEATKARRAALAMAMAQPSAAANGNGVSVIAPPAASAPAADLTPPDPARAALAKAFIEGALSSKSNTWQGAIGDLLSMYAGTRGQAATHADEKAYNAKLADAIQAGGNDPEALKAIMARIAPAKALEMAMSPKAHEWSVTPEGVMFDKHTGPASATQVGSGGATNEVKEYKFDMQQRNASGQPTIPFSQWSSEKKTEGKNIGWVQNDDGTLTPAKGGPNDPAYLKSVAESKRGDLTPDQRKAILEADQQVNVGGAALAKLHEMIGLNDKAYSGFGAQTRGYLGSQINLEGANNTEKLGNLATSEVLDTLKTTFGGNPTEGERKVLMDVQGSVNQNPSVRKAIYERAAQALQARVDLAKEQSRQLRTGEFFKPGGGASGAQAGPDGVPPRPVSTFRVYPDGRTEEPAAAQAPAPQTPVAATSSPPPPPVGFTKGGYRFKGGDPADANNWEKF
jgi:hypothetical protein